MHHSVWGDFDLRWWLCRRTKVRGKIWTCFEPEAAVMTMWTDHCELECRFRFDLTTATICCNMTEALLYYSFYSEWPCYFHFAIIFFFWSCPQAEGILFSFFSSHFNSTLFFFSFFSFFFQLPLLDVMRMNMWCRCVNQSMRINQSINFSLCDHVVACEKYPCWILTC